MKKIIASMAFGLFVLTSFPQTSAYNQNEARNNHNKYVPDNWSFDLSSGASFGLKDNEKSLFRGNSLETKISGRYQFGWVGLGFSGGLIPGSISQPGINRFLTERKIDPAQAQISRSNPSNGYFLFGPSVRLGQRIQLLAELQGGMFLNDPGTVSISQTGVQRPVYGFSRSSKNLFPGFSGTLQLAYPINSSTRFIINTDYLLSRSSIRILDLQSGIDIPTEQNRNIQLFTAGIGVTKAFGASDASSGKASSKKHISNVKYEEIKVASGNESSSQSIGRKQTQGASFGEKVLNDNRVVTPGDMTAGHSTGRRILPTGNSSVISSREAASESVTGKIYQPGKPVYGNFIAAESCGGVTEKITYPDGTTEEKKFACPEDALQYAKGLQIIGAMPNRISMNVTVPKQTQGATFGEKVNAGLHAAGSALSQGASLPGKNGMIHRDLTSRYVISGKLSWSSSDHNTAYAIVTNNTTRGGSVNMNSQNSSTRQTPQSSFGEIVRTGVATGAGAAAGAAAINSSAGVKGFSTKLYAREAGSGMATGRRSKREAGSGLATGRRQYEPVFFEGQGVMCNTCMVNVQPSPIYKEKGLSGSNPMFDKNNRTESGAKEDFDGVAHLDIYLMDPESKGIVAKTTPGAGGDFWFANVPGGEYILKVSGSLLVKKQYEISIDKSGNQDVAGEIATTTDSWMLHINTSTEEANSKAIINTSRSNIKQIVVIAADTDGDGSFDSIGAMGIFADGSSGELSVTGSGGGKKILLAAGGGAAAASYAATGKMAANLLAINLTDKNNLIAAYSDGTTQDITHESRVIYHPHIAQIVIDVEDSDGDGLADVVAGGQKLKTKSNIKNDRMMGEVLNEHGIGSLGSAIKPLSVMLCDLDGDGRAESIVGGALPGGAVISAKLAGEPIPGIDVRGRRPDGQIISTQTNQFGEFEFTNMEPGNHTIYAEQKIFIEDETLVFLGDVASSRKGWDGTVKGGSVTSDAGNLRKGWDGTVKGGSVTTEVNNLRKGWDGSIKGNSKTITTNMAVDVYYKSILIEADLDGDGEYETDISSSHSYSVTIDEKGNGSESTQKAGISTSRSNIRNKSSLQPISEDLFIVYGSTTINGKEVAVQSVLKTKHDTAKNSVGNIR